MAKSHAAAWASDAPTPAQLKEFFSQIKSGKVTKETLQELLRRKADLLRRVATIKAEGAQRFVAADHLEKANIGWTNDNFDRLFRDKVEENVPEVQLAIGQLEEFSLDAPILTELGDKTDTTLAHMFCMLKKQAFGQKGVLLVNGYTNVFYIFETDNNIWAVSADWSSRNRCWSVNASSVGSHDPWRIGDQIIFRS